MSPNPFLDLQVRAVMEKYPPYQSIFSKLSYGESQMLDKAFYEEEVKRLCLAFEQQVCCFRIFYAAMHPHTYTTIDVFNKEKKSWRRHILTAVFPFYQHRDHLTAGPTLPSFWFLQFHYAVFFAYMRLREQEIRNLMWVSECVAQNQKSRVHDSVVFIF